MVRDFTIFTIFPSLGMPDKSSKLLALRGVLKKIYPTNYEVLKYFITHLKRSVRQSGHSIKGGGGLIHF